MLWQAVSILVTPYSMFDCGGPRERKEVMVRGMTPPPSERVSSAS